MSEHSIGEAERHLSDLIDRALAGEDVVITRGGAPVAELKALPVSKMDSGPIDLVWIRANRIGRHSPPEDAGALLSRMRDEGER